MGNESRNEIPVLITSNQTAQLLRARFPLKIGSWRLQDSEIFSSPQLQNLCIKMVPSGHVLGSRALVVADTEKESPEHVRFLYTGDFITRKNGLIPPLTPIKCDILACECTYGMPFYEFPPIDVLRKGIIDWIADSLQKGPVVLYGYALGKNQEILSLLARFSEECTIICDEETCAIADVYRSAGIPLPACEPYKKYSRGKFLERDSRWILILPLGDRFNDRYQKIDAVQCRRAVFSGWTLDERWLSRWNVDAGFPLSDHASFSELISFIEKCSPSDLIFLHGDGTILKRKLMERRANILKGHVSGDVRIHALQV